MNRGFSGNIMDSKKRAGLRIGQGSLYAPDEATRSISAPIVPSSFQYDAEIYQEVVEGAQVGHI